MLKKTDPLKNLLNINLKTYQKFFFIFVLLNVILIAIPNRYADIIIYQFCNKDYFSSITHWKNKDIPTLIYAAPPTLGFGETEYFPRLLMTAKKMGWNVLPARKALNLPKEYLSNAFGFFIYNARILNAPPHPEPFPTNIPIVLIYDPVLKEEINDPLKHLQQNHRFIGYTKDYTLFGLLAVSASNINLSAIKDKIFPQLKFIMNWNFTSGSTHYQPNPNKLMYCGARWDELRNKTRKYAELWEKLAETSYFVVYGTEAWQNHPAYKGYITADGKSFIKEINKNGICLVLHSDLHLKDGVPPARIFEAAAAAAVIISDKHPFVEREFKDSVLYIDHTKEDLFEQVDAHMRWIKTHPEEAKDKARLAHAIFLQKFTEEQQLARLYEQLMLYKDERAALNKCEK